MAIFVVGINHKTAPISLREKIYFAGDKLHLYLQDLIQNGVVEEAVLLSTCNRSELYGDAHDIPRVREWFCRQSSLSRESIEAALYIHLHEDAVAHIMQVACGLDSMVLGETQILGQMKEAFSESCTIHAVSSLFHYLFQEVFAVAKEIRTTTHIGACPVSVASAAVHFAKQKFSPFAEANIVLIGGGQTTDLLLRYLKPQVNYPLSLVMRSGRLKEFDGKLYRFNHLRTALQEADVVFSATGSVNPIIDRQVVTEVMQARQQKNLIFIDIAVPRDIDHEVGRLPNVQLFCIDDLKNIIEKNRLGREHAALKARELIQQKSIVFMKEVNTLDKVSHTIRAYRGQVEDICRHELIKAKQQLYQGIDPAKVLDSFAYSFIKKLLHAPSVQLRQAGVEGRLELLRYAKQLFALPDERI